MPFVQEIDEEKGLVYIKSTGDIDPGQGMEALLHIKKFLPGSSYNRLIDLTEARYTPVTGDDKKVDRLLRLIAYAFTGKIAIVTDDPTLHMMVKLIVNIAAARRIRMEAFGSIHEAETWLT